ncbi:glycosyltransferase [Kineothrix sp. MB12-C1]|uniref:glycosyltransferase n=1 Tax=Kineothrix sp. MB12-C1 TaxID=3070215 RepID=UPI0027D26DE2|nr:glycosyltransferase [Kineothrix sp. MB12-C1]WMC93864.1 glycosyltransferase [Kineothrix sp. MB12-C1]
MTCISIIVPVYNTGKYLEQCLQSIKNQTLTDIEIICVNDGSTDNSLDILHRFADKDKRFIIIDKKNTGYGNSVNEGIKIARGEYIGIVESDDFIEKDMYQKLFEAAERTDAEIVKANYSIFKEASALPVMFNEVLEGCPYNRIFSSDDIHQVFYMTPSIWSAIYRHTFLEENNIYFRETPGASYQDTSFAFKAFMKADKVYFIKDAVINYRRDNMEASVKNQDKVFCICGEFDEIEAYIEQQKRMDNINQERYEKLLKIETLLKYRAYLWNYNRIALPYQYMFLLEMMKVFRESEREWLDWEDWRKEERETLNEILTNPDSFFKKTSKDYPDLRIYHTKVWNHSFVVKGFKELIAEADTIYIVGAGKVAQKVWKYLELSNKSDGVAGFLVTDKNRNPENIENKSVCQISEYKNIEKNSLIILAVKEKDQYDLLRMLEQYNDVNIVLIDKVIESLLD